MIVDVIKKCHLRNVGFCGGLYGMYLPPGVDVGFVRAPKLNPGSSLTGDRPPFGPSMPNLETLFGAEGELLGIIGPRPPSDSPDIRHMVCV